MASVFFRFAPIVTEKRIGTLVNQAGVEEQRVNLDRKHRSARKCI
jgi:hypothetical protein